MRYKLLGKSGLRVSELALGTMTFGEDWGFGASKEESRRMFDAYVEAGGNFIDTATNYNEGSSEKFVGEFIASNRDRYVVATKYTMNGSANGDMNFSGSQRKNMMRSLEQAPLSFQKSGRGACCSTPTADDDIAPVMAHEMLRQGHRLSLDPIEPRELLYTDDFEVPTVKHFAHGRERSQIHEH